MYGISGYGNDSFSFTREEAGWDGDAVTVSQARQKRVCASARGHVDPEFAAVEKTQLVCWGDNEKDEVFKWASGKKD